jgi:hypothetical protein
MAHTRVRALAAVVRGGGQGTVLRAAVEQQRTWQRGWGWNTRAVDSAAPPTVQELQRLVVPWTDKQGNVVATLRLLPKSLVAVDDLARRVEQGEREAAWARRSWRMMQDYSVRARAWRVAGEVKAVYAPERQQIGDAMARMPKGEDAAERRGMVAALGAKLKGVLKREYGAMVPALEKELGVGFRVREQEPQPYAFHSNDRGLLSALYTYAVERLGAARGGETVRRLVECVRRVRVVPFEQAAQRIAAAGGPAMTGEQLMALDQALHSRPRTGKTVGQDKYPSAAELVARFDAFRLDRAAFLAREQGIPAERQDVVLRELHKARVEAGIQADVPTRELFRKAMHGRAADNCRGNVSGAEMRRIIAAFWTEFRPE